MAVIDRLYTILGYKYDPKGFREFEAKAEQARRRLNTMGQQAIRTGVKLTAATAGNVLLFSSYEKEMSKIVGLVGISRDQLQKWQKDIRAIAGETGQAPRELAKALFFITSAGLRGSDAIELLRSSAKAAASGLGEQATIAQLAASAMNAYGSENLTAARAMDVLTEAVRLGQLEPATLASAMGQILPVASKLKVDFSEIGGLMAAMSRTGTEAQTAAVQLTQVMVAMLRPATSAEKALAKVGLTSQNLRDTITNRGLFAALTQVNDAFAGNEQALAEIFPNVRALRGVFDLLGEGLAVNTEIMAEMADSTGIANEAFEAGAETVDRKFKTALAGMKFAMIDLGETIAPAIVQIVEWGKALIRWFDDLSPRTKTFLGYATLLGPALIAVGLAAKAAAVAIYIFQVAVRIAAVVKAVTLAVWGLVAAFQALAAGQGAAAAMTAFRGAAVGAGVAARGATAGAAGAAGRGAAAGAGVRGAAAGAGVRGGAVAAAGGVAGVALGGALLAAPADDALRSVGWYDKNIAKPLDKIGDDYLGWQKWGGPALRAIGFAKGGLVKQPMMGMVGEAGPELVLPLDRFMDMQRQMMRPLPVAPPPGDGPGGGGVSVRLSIEKIEIMAEGGDPEDIAAGVGDALRHEMRAVVEEFDTRIRA